MKLRILIIETGLLLATSVAAWGQSALYPNEFDLGQVTIDGGALRHAQDLNTGVLLQYDTDRLLAPYLKAAGLAPKGESFECWDGLDGHVGGHYLSALAIHWAATRDPRLKERLDYVVSELQRCADANGNGYVGGVPNGAILWPEIKKGNVGRIWDWWVPWYNVHKTLAGLRDAWVYAGDERAKEMFLRFCDWTADEISGLDGSQMESMLNNEFGGMNEVLADAYAMTGDTKYLEAARKFKHRQLYDAMSRGEDNLDNRHANTQVPKAVGYQRVGEVGKDAESAKAAEFFWETVTGNRSISIGGNSRREHFPSASDAKSYVDDREGPESCNTNNMLKLTEGLFRINPEARYADYYERALFNHILSTQHPEHGGYVYFTPARPGHYRVYSQPNAGMWCCVGTGMENHGKYGQFVYTHAGNDSLYVNLFVPSTLDWKERGVKVRQETSFPDNGRIKLNVETAKGHKPVKMYVRWPAWAPHARVKVDGKDIKVNAVPGSYMCFDLKKRKQTVEIDYPMEFRVEELNYLPTYVSILRGPIVMAARYKGSESLPGLVADDSRWAHIAHGELVSVFDTPLLIGERDQIVSALNNLTPDPGCEDRFSAHGLFEGKHAGEVVLEPFYGLHDSRYMLYFLSMTPEKYRDYLVSEKAAEEERLALDRITVDAVNVGEQQPEADHYMEQKGTVRGNFNGEAWREASGNGFFAYTMRPQGKKDLQLMVRYWGNETGNRKFDILLDGEVLATEDIAGLGGKDEFVYRTYDIQAPLVDGKESVKIKFAPREGGTAGAVYQVRLVEK